MRACTKCKRPQSLSEFTKHKKEPDGIRKYCRSCAKEMRRAWYVRNYVPSSDYYKKVQAAGASRVASGENARLCRERYSKNPDKYKKMTARYHRENRDKSNIWSLLYKHRKRSAEGYCSRSKLQARIDYYGGLCWLCQLPYTDIDHVKPVSKGGTNWPANLRPICGKCNKSKSNKWPLERIYTHGT